MRKNAKIKQNPKTKILDFSMVGLVHHLAITLLKGDVLACNFAKYAYSLIKKNVFTDS